MHYAIQDFVHKTLGTRSVPTCGHALQDFMHNDLMHCENFNCTKNVLTLRKQNSMTTDTALSLLHALIIQAQHFWHICITQRSGLLFLPACCT
jgi:hypothetical protein